MNGFNVLPPESEHGSKLTSTPTSHTHTYYFYEDVGGPNEFLDLITLLHNATEYDTINIRLVSPGGQLDTCIAIVHAILACPGTVIGYLDSNADSAAALIFFACHGHVILRYSSLMVHDAAGGVLCKFNEQKKYVDFTSEIIAKLYKDILSKAFSEDEIEEVLNGKDVYLHSEEIVERLKKYNTIEEEEEEDV